MVRLFIARLCGIAPAISVNAIARRPRQAAEQKRLNLQEWSNRALTATIYTSAVPDLAGFNGAAT